MWIWNPLQIGMAHWMGYFHRVFSGFSLQQWLRTPKYILSSTEKVIMSLFQASFFVVSALFKFSLHDKSQPIQAMSRYMQQTNSHQRPDIVFFIISFIQPEFFVNNLKSKSDHPEKKKRFNFVLCTALMFFFHSIHHWTSDGWSFDSASRMKRLLTEEAVLATDMHERTHMHIVLLMMFLWWKKICF